LVLPSGVLSPSTSPPQARLRNFDRQRLYLPSRFFAVGPTLTQVLYDHGRRQAQSDVVLAQYDGDRCGTIGQTA